MKWACNKFWRKYSDIHMNLWSNSRLGGFGFESMFTLLSFQARQFSRSARSYFLQIVDDFENARSCERTGLARLDKLYLFGDKFVRIRLWKDPSPNIRICELECSWTAYEDWKGNKPSQTKKDSYASSIIASCIKHEKKKTCKRYLLRWTSLFSFLRYWLCSDSSL